MDLSKKVAGAPNVCFVSLYFSGAPAAVSASEIGNFYNSELLEDDKTDLYVTSGSLKVRETGKQGRSGLPYTQQIVFVLPTNDELRAQRINQFKKVKFIAIKLTDGRSLFFGRNDLVQNTPPKIKITSDEKLSQIEFTQKSITPLGFLINDFFMFQDGIQFMFQDNSSFK